MPEFDPQYGEAVPMGEGIVRVTADNPGPFTGAGTNSYIIGEQDLVLVDPGPNNPSHLDALKRIIGGRTLTHIVITHTHLDHVAGLAAMLEATGAVSCAEGPYREARPLHPGEENPFRNSSDTAFVPQQTLVDGEVLSNGEVDIEVVATPGHAANHIALAFNGDLLSGDHVMGWSTTVIAPPDGAMAPYMDSLDLLLGREDRKYFPGHGDLIEDPRKMVNGIKNHRLMREQAILKRLRFGDDGIPAIVEALYPAIDDRLKGAAGLSVFAQLEKLQSEGAVDADGWGRDARWRAL